MSDRLFLESSCPDCGVEHVDRTRSGSTSLLCGGPGGSRREVVVDIQKAIRTFDDEYGNGEPEEWMARVVGAALGGGDQ